MSTPEDPSAQAERQKQLIERAFLRDRVYAIGVFETERTVASQQRRAVELVDALLKKLDEDEPVSRQFRVVVVGAGVSGLNAAARAASYVKYSISGRNPARVTVLERRHELLSLFRGNHTRWLHPNIYEWPRPGCEDPDSGAELRWRANRAGDVARQIREEFDRTKRLRNIDVFYDVQHVDVGPERVTWTGRSGGDAEFDLLLLAVGYGEERTGGEAIHYWHDDDLHQIDRNHATRERRWLVSGDGDGALIDVLRLRIKDFAHDDLVLDFLHHPSLAPTKQLLLAIEDEAPRRGRSWLYARYFELPVPAAVDELIRQRLREDTSVVMCGQERWFLRIGTSILHRFLVTRLIKVDRATTFLHRPGKLISEEVKNRRIKLESSDGNALEYLHFDRVHCRWGIKEKPEPLDGLVSPSEIRDAKARQLTVPLPRKKSRREKPTLRVARVVPMGNALVELALAQLVEDSPKGGVLAVIEPFPGFRIVRVENGLHTVAIVNDGRSGRAALKTLSAKCLDKFSANVQISEEEARKAEPSPDPAAEIERLCAALAAGSGVDAPLPVLVLESVGRVQRHENGPDSGRIDEPDIAALVERAARGKVRCHLVICCRAALDGMAGLPHLTTISLHREQDVESRPFCALAPRWWPRTRKLSKLPFDEDITERELEIIKWNQHYTPPAGPTISWQYVPLYRSTLGKSREPAQAMQIYSHRIGAFLRAGEEAGQLKWGLDALQATRCDGRGPKVKAGDRYLWHIEKAQYELALCEFDGAMGSCIEAEKIHDAVLHERSEDLVTFPNDRPHDVLAAEVSLFAGRWRIAETSAQSAVERLSRPEQQLERRTAEAYLGVALAQQSTSGQRLVRAWEALAIATQLEPSARRGARHLFAHRGIFYVDLLLTMALRQEYTTGTFEGGTSCVSDPKNADVVALLSEAFAVASHNRAICFSDERWLAWGHVSSLQLGWTCVALADTYVEPLRAISLKAAEDLVNQSAKFGDWVLIERRAEALKNFIKSRETGTA